MEGKKVIYISGPIAGVENYWEPFEAAEEDLISLGYTPLIPTHLPKGMTNAQYMRINFAMIDSADAVVFLPGWRSSEGAKLEQNYCRYTGKPMVYQRTYDPVTLDRPSRECVRTNFKLDLEEVLSL